MINCEVETILSDPELRSYAVLTVNSSNLILLASLNGTVKIINPAGCVTLNSAVIEGKIFSAELFSDQFLLNGVEGRLVLCRFGSNGTCDKVAEGTLPVSKQRWFSVAREWNDILILGDRVGSLHLYRRENLELKQTFKKIHGRNGVTDLRTVRKGNIIFN